MNGRVLQINVSPRGGIPKRRIEHGYVTRLGLEGDAVAHPNFHGAPNQAVLMITQGAIDELNAMGYEIFSGALGENFTVAGLDRRAVRLGERYRIGECTAEISKLRQPCDQLNVYNREDLPRIQKQVFDAKVKAGDFSSPRWGLAGFYARIVEEGIVREGDEVELLQPQLSTETANF
ncbi:MAG TPA: MOSC domain-containing protein [Bryobacteraceae bacterium]|nr:MOSC domain-containing protein [Bryobacteraceae bacterium]